jgi:hypothetical protein
MSAFDPERVGMQTPGRIVLAETEVLPTNTRGGSLECLVSRFLNGVENDDANDRDNHRGNAG